MEIYVKNFVSHQDFIIYINFAYIVASQQLMTSQSRPHIEYLTLLKYYCAHFVLKIDGKSTLTDGF